MPSFLLLFFTTICCNSDSKNQESSRAATSFQQSDSSKKISVPQLHSLIESSQPIIIDVRTETEFTSGHIPSAQNIPLSDLPDRLNDLKEHQNKDIYLVCAVGGRSGEAQKYLNELGFSTTNVVGGTEDWKRKQYPIELPE